MKIRFLNSSIFLTLLVCGCVTLGTATKDGRLKEDIQLYVADLDNDQIPESIEVYDKGRKHSDVEITVAKPKKPKLASITAPGVFNKIEIIDLNEDGYKQLALYYEDDSKANLVIYNFKDNKLTETFSIKNECIIETDFSSVLARIKLGKPKPGQSDCLTVYPEEWQTLVWTGEKFLKEK